MSPRILRRGLTIGAVEGSMVIRQMAQLPRIGVSNRYSVSANEQVPTRELTLILDSDTGLLSLGNNFTVNELRHSHEWLKYQEPEAHCLALGEEVLKLAKIPEGVGVAGLSWKDAGLIDSCARFGHDTTILYPSAQQRGNSPEFGTWERDSIDVQELISNDDLGVSGPQFSFLSARHILEHAMSLEHFMLGLATKVKPDGYVLLEVPDCEDAVRYLDYSIIWEEHIHYFTASSLERTLQRLGWRLVELQQKTVEAEAVLIAIVQPPIISSAVVAPKESRETYIEQERFAANFSELRVRLSSLLNAAKQAGNTLYLLGANHTASNFIDLFGVAGLFSGCLDDNPNKQGKYISSLNVPIIAVDPLRLEGNSFIISAINPGRAEAAERKLVYYLESRVIIRRVSALIRFLGNFEGTV